MQQSKSRNGSTIQRDGVVGLGGERPAVHHRARVGLRVVVGRERDRPLGLAADAVVVHEAHDPHGEALRRRDQPVREGERRLAGDASPPAARRRSAGTGPARARGRRRRSRRSPPRSPRPRCRPRPSRRRRRRPTACWRSAARAGRARRPGARDRCGRCCTTRSRRSARGSIPASAHAREDGPQRQLELGLGRLAVLVVGGLADARHRDPPTDRSHAGIPFRIWYGGL